MKHSMFAALLLLWGCASFEPPDATYILPALISQSPLPLWPYQNVVPELTLIVKVRVAADGSVSNVRLLSTSGDRGWDSLATAQIGTWRYAPAVVNGQPVAMWVQQVMHVRFEKPMLLSLAELVCDDERLADSLYVLLRSGASFDTLVQQFSVSESRSRGGSLGEVDLRTFPQHIRTEVLGLGRLGITKPLNLGRQFVIYRRLPSSV